MKVMTIVGTRPEIIRLSCVIDVLDASVDHVLVNTHQNLDPKLNEAFFSDLEIRDPDHQLSVASHSTIATISNVMAATEELLTDIKPDIVLCLGDTNTAYSLLAAKKMGYPTVHLEAGNRSFDARVPEELNRRVIDHIADLNVCYSSFAAHNLLREGLHPNSIVVLGSPMFEVAQRYEQKINNSSALSEHSLKENQFILLSLHRNENLASIDVVRNTFSALDMFCRVHKVPVVVSAHPALQKVVEKLCLPWSQYFKFCAPFRYTDYCKLQRQAKLVISDSGSIVEESSIFGFPAISLRANHERQEANSAISTVQCDPFNPDFTQIYGAICACLDSGKYQIACHSEYRNENFSAQLVLNIISFHQRLLAKKVLS